MFTRAIVRPPAPKFAEGLTTAGLGAPDYERALHQHEAYCAALERCGLSLIRLEPDPNYPDSTFVEDVAVLAGALPDGRATAPVAVLTRPGAPSRRGEVAEMRSVLSRFFPSLHEIQAPGTLDGGDICLVGDHFYIGVSSRTNEAGATQLATILGQAGYTSSLVDIAQTASLLHLKSGIAWLGENSLAVTEPLAGRPGFGGYELVRVDQSEEYAANCIRVNDYVLVAAGFPKFQAELQARGYETIAREMSEFQKMDGGLSCLSLRF